MHHAILVFDDDCGFCTWWAELFAARSATTLVGFSELTPELRAELPEHFERCAHVLVAGERYACGEAMEEAFIRSDYGRPLRPLIEFLRGNDGYVALREWTYGAVAGRRDLWGKVLSKRPPARSDADAPSRE